MLLGYCLVKPAVRESDMLAYEGGDGKGNVNIEPTERC